ncbi:hypothetical protein [Paraburkholderia lacunae]|uniref:Uncharacterized protein n=1 Tax=Paraburkholderia lacunae TaxID=2211104 RepID=A0A370N984_9BURK|nr:hypothetical protein [Paraburkholderia lacunae]RDK02161.1 hypothetical protein DLM46_14605 [Paraburkholderia lacunae]
MNDVDCSEVRAALLTPPSRTALERAARTGRSKVDGAWSRFKAGDTAGYLSSVAAAVDAAYENGAHVVALAQASMAGASALVTRGEKPLTSPATGLAAAVPAATLLI